MSEEKPDGYLPPLSGTQRKVPMRDEESLHIFTDGPHYSMGGYTHFLPSPKSLKPNMDTRAGQLDTWPANSSVGQGSIIKLTKSKSLVLLNEEDLGKTQLVPKPHFLSKLEAFLKKELISLGVADTMPNELRLQVYREVFEYLMEDFKTYKPLLSSIKNEYEMMLAHLREEIQKLTPLKQLLVATTEKCEQQILIMREQEKQDIVDLKMESKSLQRHIFNMKEKEKDLICQVKKLSAELEETYLKYKDEHDARKLLISDINELRYEKEEAALIKPEEKVVEEDLVTLKISLRKIREDEKRATQKLNEMVANYADVIPRREFEQINLSFTETRESYKTLQEDFHKLKAEHEALLYVHQEVTQQRDDYYIECERMKTSATPRPNWDKCAEYINGGMARWKLLSEGKSSEELVEILLNELAEGGFADSTNEEFFDGKGTGVDVPKYLQHEGPVKNRRILKRDCALMVRDIWREKYQHDLQITEGPRSTLADYLYIYLQNNFALEQLVVEWAYNLVDACHRYASDENIGLFGKILSGEVNEDVYHSHLEMMSKLMAHVTSQEEAKENNGKLKKEFFKKTLQEFLNTTNDDIILNLVKAAEEELGTTDTEEIEWQNLFLEDDEGNVGPFLSGIKAWLENEKAAFIEDIEKELDDTRPVSVEDLKRALSLADPEIDELTMERYLCWAFQTTADSLPEAEPVVFSDLAVRLQNGNIIRCGRKLE